MSFRTDNVFVLGIVTAPIVCGMLSATASAQAMQKFGTREPRTCNGARGSPSASNIALLVRCSEERNLGDTEVLLTDLRLQVGQPRRFLPNVDVNMPQVNILAPIYPIRGSYVEWTCGAISSIQQNQGRNCARNDVANGHGVCWKTAFGDRKCNINSETDNRKYRVAPPTG